MKKGELKQEVCRSLETIKKHIEQSTADYDSDTLKYLLSEAMAYYDLYLLKKNNKKIEAQKLEQKYSGVKPSWVSAELASLYGSMYNYTEALKILERLKNEC